MWFSNVADDFGAPQTLLEKVAAGKIRARIPQARPAGAGSLRSRLIRKALVARGAPAGAQAQATAAIALQKAQSDIAQLQVEKSQLQAAVRQLGARSAESAKAIANLNELFKRLTLQVGKDIVATHERVKMAEAQVKSLTGASRPAESFRPINAEPPKRFIQQPSGVLKKIKTVPFQPEAQPDEPQTTMETPAAEMEMDTSAEVEEEEEEAALEAFYGEDESA